MKLHMVHRVRALTTAIRGRFIMRSTWIQVTTRFLISLVMTKTSFEGERLLLL